MAYTRHLAEQQPDGTGTPAPTQPTSVNRVDVYGNSYEDWCGDYISHDVDCNPVVFTSPPGYTGPIATFLCTLYEPSLWGHKDVDNNTRPLSQYEHNVTVFDPYIPTPDNPLPVDETDITFEILHSGSIFSLRMEESNTVIIPGVNTDVVFTGPSTIQ